MIGSDVEEEQKIYNECEESEDHHRDMIAAMHMAGKNRVRCLGLGNKGKGKALLRFDSATHFRVNQPKQSTDATHGSLRKLRDAVPPGFEFGANKKLERFDSATHFAAHQPAQSTASVQGSLVELRHEAAGGPPRRVGARKAGSDAAGTGGAVNLGLRPESTDENASTAADARQVLCAYVQQYAGTWAHGCTGDADFAKALTSGLCRLATDCAAESTSSDASDVFADLSPWDAVAAMSPSEHRALAAVVATLVIREARKQKQSPKVARPKNEHSERDHAHALEPHPPSAARPMRFWSLRRSRPGVTHSSSSPISSPGPCDQEPVAQVAASASAGTSLRLPLSDEFWATLVRHALKTRPPASESFVGASPAPMRASNDAAAAPKASAAFARAAHNSTATA